MASRADATLPATRRSRKSVGGQSPSRKLGDKENATVDVGSTMAAGRKKSRSKSIGPGGLDVLKPGAGNRRVSLAAPSRPPPRSILKPTIPLLPEIPPHRPKDSTSQTGGTATSSSDGENSGTKIALRTEEEQQAAAREREEKERAAAEKEINDRREARRKSLANRRVSFAAEATLHTFHEVEYMHDSTTSTESSRRASSARSPASHLGSDASAPPSTQEEEGDRDIQQKKRRRSSGAPQLNFNNPEDNTLSSTIYSSDSEQADDVAEIQGEELSDSDSEVEDGTVMTVEADEMTSASVASVRSTSTASDSTSLDQNLRLAAQRAVTQQLDEDEEEIPAFAGWGKKNRASQESTSNFQESTPSPAKEDNDATQTDMSMDMDMDIGMDTDMDMDMTSAVGRIIKPQTASPQKDDDDDDEMSMDVTRALGGIISQSKPSTRRQSRVSPRKSVYEESLLGEETMDFTTAVGGIQSGRHSDGSQTDLDGNEDMSMELTTAIGGVLPSKLPKKAPAQTRRRTVTARDNASNDDATMDMTVAVGRILPTSSRKDRHDDDEATMGMDMTTALGGIIKPSSNPDSRSAAKQVMEQEANEPDAPVAATVETTPSPKKSAAATTAEDASPSLNVFRGKGLRRTPTRAASSTPKSPKTKAAPTPKTTSPPKPASPPKKTAPGTPTKPSPKAPPRMIGSRSSSPVRQVSPRRMSTPKSPSSSKSRENSVFRQDPTTGASTPLVILTPQRRRLSGVGVDRSGLGSPKITELFDRRDSIGNSAEAFVPGQGGEARKGVAFVDPREMAGEIDRERQEDEDRENRRKILEREADGSPDEREVTLNLKEMIQGLTPKKNPMKGRKSLHVGSARGLLGKRPAELDDDEEAEERDGVKRLKGHQGSPVKNVKLRSPPSKAETTGRITRSSKNGAGWAGDDTTTPTVSQSPTKATTPRSHGRFKSVDDQPSTTFNFDHSISLNETEEAQDDGEDRIHLQDFLNMTSIRFMELNTTKRRHTIAPTTPKDSGSADDKDNFSLERCVVAGACTVPMLELYQHSCRELKKYISEGRRIVREIESETFEENPPLFREYMSASPDFKIIMDNQFKNVKTHARLLSKAMWYEWRMKLQDGLKEGLVKIAEGMAADDELLTKKEELLASVVPEMLRRHESLKQEHENLVAVAKELADCDPSELEDARSELVSLDEDIEEKTRKIEELRQQLRESEDDVKTMASQKQSCLEEIKASDKIREECRGWSPTEIMALKAKVDALEKQHGWAITGITGTTVSMAYRREIELVFDIASFQPGHENSPIDLWYIAANREHNPEPLTQEKQFFVQCAREQVRGLAQGQTKLSRMLGMVRAAWDKATAVANHVRLLNLTFPTTVTKTSDNSIAIKSSLLLVPLTSKVDVVLNLHGRAGADGVDVDIVPQASIVYGEHFKVAKMAEFLATRIGDHVLGKAEAEDAELWCDVVAELHGRLLARGRR